MAFFSTYSEREASFSKKFSDRVPVLPAPVWSVSDEPFSLRPRGSHPAPHGSSLGLIPLLDAQGSHSFLRSMDWMRAGPAPLLDERRAPGGVPKFVLVDANNRVRELTDTRKAATAPGDGGGFLMRRQAAPPARAPLESENVDMEPSPEELAEQAQLEQQLRVQKEEMRFLAPLPKPQAPSLQFAAHANTYAAPASTPAFPRHSHSHHANQAPSPPPVSPFAGLAVSAPSKTSPMGGFGHARPTNPFSGATVKIENSPRLPSLSAFRSGSPGSAHLNGSGIPSHRPPPLSLRSFSDVSSLSASASSQPSPLHRPPPRSHSSGSFYAPSPRASTPPMYSQSLPGVSFLQDRAASSRLSFDSADTVGLSSEDDDSAHGGMLLLSSSIEHSMNGGFTVGSAPGSLGAAAAAAARSGRVCRYSNCNNIARSRGLCRTHGGGKRCSHPNCNKSAQANRKCIAHGGGTPCSFGDCEKTAQSRGLCKAHGGGARCKYPDCPKSSQSKGLCRGHGGGIKCKEDGCEKWVQKNGYCIKHGRERSMTS